ncbi:hypothetical protein [Fimbriimonas ginsengisoli]|uniref:hypothetical protein n=1 Tax=Fimbriimonas ginsengisoli TaxID=1005039 RepID=UPI00046D34B0|nr:hypothetical protein [Fimbriimonas ginsengisoli]
MLTVWLVAITVQKRAATPWRVFNFGGPHVTVQVPGIPPLVEKQALYGGTSYLYERSFGKLACSFATAQYSLAKKIKSQRQAQINLNQRANDLGLTGFKGKQRLMVSAGADRAVAYGEGTVKGRRFGVVTDFIHSGDRVWFVVMSWPKSDRNAEQTSLRISKSLHWQ